MLEAGNYLGKFWIPNENVWYIGSLKIDSGGNSELEIHQTEENYSHQHFGGYHILWGIIADDIEVSLFNVMFKQSKGSSFVLFSVRNVLANCHIQSMDDPLFIQCKVEFPFLKNWICQQRISISFSKEVVELAVNSGNIKEPTSTIDLDDEVQLEIHEYLQTKVFNKSFKGEINQCAYCIFRTTVPQSINYYKHLITEFNQFLSVALYCRQYPNRVEFCDNTENLSTLFFPVSKSKEPHKPLIQFAQLKEKVPMMLQNWHKQFEQIAPICRYLLQSLNADSFDFPDFLIIAQALDGYYKRFFNKKDGIDRRKYKDGIDALLAHFSNVNAIKDAQIDSDVLEQSRNKYSHLIPDDDCKITKAVSGRELFDLTRKCKVLLTCCILDMLGLTVKEIDMCIKKSSARFLVSDNPILSSMDILTENNKEIRDI